MTNIGTEDFARMYRFLSERNQESGDAGWYEEASGKDGHLIYSEFYNYVKEHWDNSTYGALDSDIIGKFFNSMDFNTKGRVQNSRLTNKGVLTKEEVANLDNKFAYYQVLEAFLNELPLDNLGLDDEIIKACKDEFETELFAEVIADKINKPSQIDRPNANLRKELEDAYQECSKRIIGTHLKDQIIKDSYLTKLAEEVPGFDTKNSQDLKNIVLALVNDKNIETIEELNTKLKGYLQAYFATIGNANLAKAPRGYNLADLKLDGKAIISNSTLNNLQKADIENCLKTDSMRALAEQYSDAKTLFDEYLLLYIKEVQQGSSYNGNYSEYKADLSAKMTVDNFKKSEIYNKFVLAYETYVNLYSNVDFEANPEATQTENSTITTSMLLDKLTEKIGDAELAQVIIERGVVNPAYKKMIDDILEQIKEGKLTNADEILEYISSNIVDNITNFIDNNTDKLTIELIEKFYNDEINDANGISGNMLLIKAKQEAAIKACDKMVILGEQYQKAVIEMFTSDYADKIKSMIPKDFEPMMQELFAKVKDIQDGKEEETPNLSGITAISDDKQELGSKFTLVPNQTMVFNLSMPNSNADWIEYEAISDNNDIVTVSQSTGTGSKLTLKSNKSGAAHVKICAKDAQGNLLGTPMVVQIIVSDSVEMRITDENGKLSSEVDNAIPLYWGPNGQTLGHSVITANETATIPLTGNSFAYLYNGSAIVELGFAFDYYKDGVNALEKAMEDLYNNFKYLKDLVCGALSKVPGIDIDKLNEAATSIMNLRYNNFVNNPYGHLFGNNEGTTIDNVRKNAYNSRPNEGYIYGMRDEDGDDSVGIYINFKAFVDDIMNKYNQLI